MKNTKKIIDYSAQINELKEQVASLDDKYRRALADYQNQEKRSVLNRQIAIKFANEQLLTDLLPIFDDLNRAQSHLNDAGLGHVINSLATTLKNYGLVSFSPQGEVFEPLTMECVEVVEGEQDQVVTVSQVGYKLDEKVLRPAKVTVGRKTI